MFIQRRRNGLDSIFALIDFLANPTLQPTDSSQLEEELSEIATTIAECGVDEMTVLEVAKQLTQHDAIGAHARDGLGIADLFNHAALSIGSHICHGDCTSAARRF